MSKMPAKKKSCFQITSVTPAQVAASAPADDTESLEDPDESRAEDDVSRADGEARAAGRSSPEEAPGAQGELLAGPPNGGVAFRSAALGGVGPQTGGVGGAGGLVPGASGVVSSQPLPPAAVPATSASTGTSSCTSRFRVIKLDHGTGEPFRRGRWTCLEFYEKDAESSVGSRTADSLRHISLLDHASDRDSGMGTTVSLATVSSLLSGPGPETGLEGSFASGLQVSPAEPPLQQSSGSVLPGAFQPPGHITVPAQPAAAPQNLLPPGHDGTPPIAPLQQVQQPPGPPTYAYPGQHSPAHVLSTQPTTPGDYRQPHVTLLQPQGVGGPLSSPAQGPSPVITPAAGGALPLGIPGKTLDSPTPGLVLQQKPVGQYQPSGGSLTTSSSVAPSPTPTEQPHVGRGPGTQGAAFSSPVEDSRRQPDALPHGPISFVMEASKAESLQPPPSPVSNLFGIPIDEDDDGSWSAGGLLKGSLVIVSSDWISLTCGEVWLWLLDQLVFLCEASDTVNLISGEQL
ncbi:TSC22 domain family protein 2-like isoform X2 [Scleropages formosus]|uniref:TSC22 domain family protein 2-like isoform X2 n=1 Tax=Scleropages formosus TaxID=113540 RepID=UPI0010FACB83|nr:TSC22 domain family protein 2-like isoform X2 [Scleropages formosus]